jgi:hypothetical protein
MRKKRSSSPEKQNRAEKRQQALKICQICEKGSREIKNAIATAKTATVKTTAAQIEDNK